MASATPVGTQALLRAVAAWDLPTSATFPSEPLDDAAFDALLSAGEQHRLLGLMAAAVSHEELHVTTMQRARLEEVLVTWLSHDVKVERLLLRTAKVFEDAQVDFRVLKGVGLAHTAYADPALRVFGDLDLLVPSDRFGEAAQLIAQSLGGERAMPELRRGFDERFGKEIMLRVDAMELDLHRTLVEGPLGIRIRADDLFSAPQQVPIGGRTVPALSTEAQLVHAAFAAALGDWPPRLMSQRDVVELVLHAPIDVERIIQMARRWRSGFVLAEAIRESWTALRITATHALSTWTQAQRPTRWERTLLRSYRGPARGYSSQLASLLELNGVRNRAGFVMSMAFPSGDYLAARSFRRSELARRAMRSIRPSRRP